MSPYAVSTDPVAVLVTEVTSNSAGNDSPVTSKAWVTGASIKIKALVNVSRMFLIGFSKKSEVVWTGAPYNLPSFPQQTPDDARHRQVIWELGWSFVAVGLLINSD